MTLKKYVSNLTRRKQTKKEYKQYTNNSTKCTFKPLDVTVKNLSHAHGHKMSNYAAVNNR